MLAALVFVAVQGQAAIEAKVYEARFDGPAPAATICYFYDSEGARAQRRSRDRKVTITVTDRGTRCDTDGWISVVKTAKSEYFLIDHKKRTVLVFPATNSQEGLEAVCATTPLWPEAYGDGTSFEQIRKVPKSTEHVIYQPRMRLDTQYEGSDFYSYTGSHALGPLYSVTDGDVEGFHNLAWFAYDDRTPLGLFWMMRFRGPEMYRSKNKPVAKTETVAAELFTYPAEYRVLVAGPSEGYAGSERADKDQVRQYVADFEIPVVFSAKKVYGRDRTASEARDRAARKER